jgi:hypothetical protein
VFSKRDASASFASAMRPFGHTYAVKQICPAPVRIVSRLGIWWANEGSFASVHLPLVDADQTDVAVATTGGRTTLIHLEHSSKPPRDIVQKSCLDQPTGD